MQRYRTKAIILRRVDYAEADRVITFLSKQYGKISVIAKAVRKEKSRLAGGIELFSESDITVVEGKGSLDILTSARLIKHYERIVSDYDRVVAGYDVIKVINDKSEDGAGVEFYELIKTTFKSLNNLELPLDLVIAWYRFNILMALGSEPNLNRDSNDKKLSKEQRYIFDFREGALVPDEKGNIEVNHIKSWRLLLTQSPETVAKVKGAPEAISETSQIIDGIYHNTPGI